MSDLSGAVVPPAPAPTPLQELITLLVAELKKQVAAEATAEIKAVEAVVLKRCCVLLSRRT